MYSSKLRKKWNDRTKNNKRIKTTKYNKVKKVVRLLFSFLFECCFRLIFEKRYPLFFSTNGYYYVFVVFLCSVRWLSWLYFKFFAILRKVQFHEMLVLCDKIQDEQFLIAILRRNSLSTVTTRFSKFNFVTPGSSKPIIT